MELTKPDLIAINNALNEILHGPDAIDDAEFQTRVGVDRADAVELLDRVRSEIETAR